MSHRDLFAAARRAMLAEQLIPRRIRDPAVLSALGRVPREDFVPAGWSDRVYDDCALPIDCGQTISQPYLVALMSEALAVDDRHHVLEIGTGSGYQTAVLAELAHDVVTIERHPTLSQQAQRALGSLGYRNVRFLVGDGSLGWPAGAPYDRILVAAAAAAPPEALCEQLAEGGLLVVPVGPPQSQTLEVLRKSRGTMQVSRLIDCRFVPLVEGGPTPDA